MSFNCYRTFKSLIPSVVLLCCALIASSVQADPAEVSIEADIQFQADSLLTMEIAGASIGPPAEYDRLLVDGQVSVIGGTLEVLLIDDFHVSISHDDQFNVVTTTEGLIGEWANVANGERLDTIEGSGSFLVHYGPQSAENINDLVLSDFLPPITTAHWLGGNDDWFTASRWDINSVPNNSGTEIYEVVNSTSGDITLTEDVSVYTFSQASPQALLQGNGTLTVDILNWEGGLLYGSGDLVVRESGAIGPNSQNHALRKKIVNQGMLTWGETRVTGNDTGSIQNDPGATLVLSGGGSTGTNDVHIDNLVGGTIKVMGDDVDDDFDMDSRFDSNGKVEVQSGRLVLSRGGSLNGPVDIAADSVLQLSGGTGRRVSITGDISGPGVLILQSGTASFENISGSHVANLLMNTQGHISGNGNVTIENLTWNGSGSMQAGGTTTVTNSATFIAINNPLHRQLTIAGTLDWQNDFLFGNGTLTTEPKAVANLIGTGGTSGGGGDDTTIDNNGTMIVDDPASQGVPEFTFRSEFSNNGVIDVRSGTLTLDDVVVQHAGTSLTGGTWQVRNDATLAITSGASIATNQATVILRGPNSSFDKINTLANNQGRFEIHDGREFNTAGDLANSREIVVGTGSSLTVNGTYSQSGETSLLQVNGHFASTDGPQVFANNATLSGTGVINADVVIDIDGIVMPGPKVGTLTVDRISLDRGIFQWELDEAGNHDSIVVTEALTLGSAATVRLIDLGGKPDPTTEYVLFDYATTNNDPLNATWSLDGTLAPNWDLSQVQVSVDPVTDRVLLTGLSVMEMNEPRLLQAGDADQDFDFDQLDLVRVQIAAKYLTGKLATWGEGDWNGAPGGEPGMPPAGNGLFDQTDIIAALSSATYLTGPYAALAPGGNEDDENTSLVYNTNTGELSVDAPASTELTSLFVISAGNLFIGDKPAGLDGPFDSFGQDNVFKSTIGGSFGDSSFGNVLPPGLSEVEIVSDLSASGSLVGGDGLSEVDLVYVPEPASAVLMLVGLAIGLFHSGARCITPKSEIL